MSWSSSTSSARSSSSSRYSVRAYHKFKLDDLEKATSKFDVSKIILKGEFGITYEGLLDDGETVAVKRYNLNGNIADEHRNEITKLSKVHHPNLVALIGMCEDPKTQELIVVHEFMKNGTLADHLFGEGEGVSLSWDQRLRICIDAARGLEYLHHGFANSKRLIHRNINLTNILLDEYWTAKISEFGLANLGIADAQNSATTRMSVPYKYRDTDVKGTYRYRDPYYFLTGQLTRMTDVYAFGVVLFDVLFANTDFNGEIDKKKENLGQWTQQRLKDGSLDGIIDERLKGQISPETLKEFAELASSCVLDNRMSRPTMTVVLERLQCILKTSQNARP